MTNVKRHVTETPPNADDDTIDADAAQEVEQMRTLRKLKRVAETHPDPLKRRRAHTAYLGYRSWINGPYTVDYDDE